MNSARFVAITTDTLGIRSAAVCGASSTNPISARSCTSAASASSVSVILQAAGNVGPRNDDGVSTSAAASEITGRPDNRIGTILRIRASLFERLERSGPVTNRTSASEVRTSGVHRSGRTTRQDCFVAAETGAISWNNAVDIFNRARRPTPSRANSSLPADARRRSNSLSSVAKIVRRSPRPIHTWCEARELLSLLINGRRLTSASARASDAFDEPLTRRHNPISRRERRRTNQYSLRDLPITRHLTPRYTHNNLRDRPDNAPPHTAIHPQQLARQPDNAPPHTAIHPQQLARQPDNAPPHTAIHPQQLARQPDNAPPHTAIHPQQLARPLMSHRGTGPGTTVLRRGAIIVRIEQLWPDVGACHGTLKASTATRRSCRPYSTTERS